MLVRGWATGLVATYNSLHRRRVQAGVSQRSRWTNASVFMKNISQHGRTRSYCIELAACEKTVLALEPISRIVPTTMTRITASITAYSAMSWP